MAQIAQIKKIQKLLSRWYARHKRALPWRKTRDPYAVWISEIMLQQTRVDTVIPYFKRWMKRFPTMQSLAKAGEEEVLKHWEGLGYYSRARNLHRAAKQIASSGTKFPDSKEALLALPGIGKYTAGAILSIAFDQREPLVDGNVFRVFARLFNIHSDIEALSTRKKIWGLASAFVPEKNPGDFNQALMELGAAICVPGAPRCLLCPVRSLCEGFQQSDPSRLPVFKVKKKIEPFSGWMFLAEHNGRYLIQKRPEGQVMGGLWEFPSKMEGALETPEKLVWRHLKLRGDAQELPGKIKAAFTKFRGDYRIAHIRLKNLGMRKTQVHEQWILPQEAGKYTFSAPSRKLLRLLKGPTFFPPKAEAPLAQAGTLFFK
ncbi:MAG: A/G-specific adenine glycosylase [Candidatus Omnitrophica bacterium]|nr:A/G-specific adenine glycosylase [Candidatus Omnitrophota bacterium]